MKKVDLKKLKPGEVLKVKPHKLLQVQGPDGSIILLKNGDILLFLGYETFLPDTSGGIIRENIWVDFLFVDRKVFYHYSTYGTYNTVDSASIFLDKSLERLQAK